MYVTPILQSRHEMSNYLKLQPAWLAGFVTGEGCFTASIVVNERSAWGFWPQCSFILSQSVLDRELLLAVKDFFGVGEVYDKPNNVSVYMVRDTKDLLTVFIPFFQSYPTLGRKAQAFLIWKSLVESNMAKALLGNSLSARDALVSYLTSVMLLNQTDSRTTARKQVRYRTIVDWLTQLEAAPTINQKLQLKQQLKNLHPKAEDN